MDKNSYRSREYKCKSNFDLRGAVRNAQSLTLSGVPTVLGAAGAYKLTGTAARASILQILALESSGDGSVSSIKIAGQSLNVTDQDGHIAAFTPKCSNATAKQRYIGIAVKSQQASTISIQGDLNAAGTIGFGLSVHPIEDEQVPTIESQAEFYNYFGGLGKQQIPAAGSAQLKATTTRSCSIGLLTLFNETGGVPNEDLRVTSVEVNGLEYMAGNSDAETPLNNFATDAGDTMGNLIHADVEANAVITVTIKNVNAAPADVRGTFFCL